MIPSIAHVGFSKAVGPGKVQEFYSVIRHRGGVGGGVSAGELDSPELRDHKSSKKEEKSSTFVRLWKEARREKGHLAMAAVCLLVSSSANLMAPSILARYRILLVFFESDREIASYLRSCLF